MDEIIEKLNKTVNEEVLKREIRVLAKSMGAFAASSAVYFETKDLTKFLVVNTDLTIEEITAYLTKIILSHLKHYPNHIESDFITFSKLCGVFDGLQDLYRDENKNVAEKSFSVYKKLNESEKIEKIKEKLIKNLQIYEDAIRNF
jgi:hypothetical protein